MIKLKNFIFLLLSGQEYLSWMYTEGLLQWDIAGHGRTPEAREEGKGKARGKGKADTVRGWGGRDFWNRQTVCQVSRSVKAWTPEKVSRLFAKINEKLQV